MATYLATFLPGFERWVVTTSVDIMDVWGATDFANGGFRAGSDLARSTGRIIVRYWREQQCFDEAEGGWAHLLVAGAARFVGCRAVAVEGVEGCVGISAVTNGA